MAETWAQMRQRLAAQGGRAATLPDTSTKGYVDVGDRTYVVPTQAQKDAIAAAQERRRLRLRREADQQLADRPPPPRPSVAASAASAVGNLLQTPPRRTAPPPATPASTVPAAPAIGAGYGDAMRAYGRGVAAKYTGGETVRRTVPMAAAPPQATETVAPEPVAPYQVAEAAPAAAPRATLPTGYAQEQQYVGDLRGGFTGREMERIGELKSMLPADIADGMQFYINPNDYYDSAGNLKPDAKDQLTLAVLEGRAREREAQRMDELARIDRNIGITTPRNLTEYKRYSGNAIPASVEATAREQERYYADVAAAKGEVAARRAAEATLPETRMAEALGEKLDVRGKKAQEVKMFELEDAQKKYFWEGDNFYRTMALEYQDRWKNAENETDRMKIRAEWQMQKERLVAQAQLQHESLKAAATEATGRNMTDENVARINAEAHKEAARIGKMVNPVEAEVQINESVTKGVSYLMKDTEPAIKSGPDYAAWVNRGEALRQALDVNIRGQIRVGQIGGDAQIGQDAKGATFVTWTDKDGRKRAERIMPAAPVGSMATVTLPKK